MLQGIIFGGFTQRNSTADRKYLIYPMSGPYRLRTYLEQNGYAIEVVDFFDWWTEKELLRLIDKRVSKNPEMKFIGFGTTFLTGKNITKEFLSAVRAKHEQLKIIVGGQEPWLHIWGDNPDKSQLTDMIFYGHAENALLEYVKMLNGEDHNFKSEKYKLGGNYIISPNVLPYNDTQDLSIVWKKDDPLKYFKAATIEISRGCMFKCDFCFTPLMGKKKMDYLRSPQNLADEIKRNYDLFGITHYALGEDTMNESIAKLEWIRKGIKLSGIDITFSTYLRHDLMYAHKEQIDILCEIGLVGAAFGIESLNPTARKSIGKGLNNDQIYDVLYRLKKAKPDLISSSSFLVGLPGETAEEFLKDHEDFMQLNKNYEYLDLITWQPLVIMSPTKYLNSAFSTNASKYGYNVVPYTGAWTNEQIGIKSFSEAVSISNQITQKYFSRASYAHEVSELIGLGCDIHRLLDHKLNWHDIRTQQNPIKEDIIRKYKDEKFAE